MAVLVVLEVVVLVVVALVVGVVEVVLVKVPLAVILIVVVVVGVVEVLTGLEFEVVVVGESAMVLFSEGRGQSTYSSVGSSSSGDDYGSGGCVWSKCN